MIRTLHREHLWRAHSPTHNCRYCRKSTATSTAKFRQHHAHCTPSSAIDPRPRPFIMSSSQADALQAMNQHFNEPNDEYARCKKLVTALFPGHAINMSLIMTPIDSQFGHESDGSHSNAESKRKQRTAHLTPDRKPDDLVRKPPRKTLPHPFRPGAGNVSFIPESLRAGSRDSGLGTEPSHYDDQPDPTSRTTPGSGITMGSTEGFPARMGYPLHVLEDPEDVDCGEVRPGQSYSVEDVGERRPDESSSEYADTSDASNNSTSSS